MKRDFFAAHADAAFAAGRCEDQSLVASRDSLPYRPPPPVKMIGAEWLSPITASS